MKLIMTIGAPGSGKTKFANDLAAQLREKGEMAAIFSKDSLRNMMTGSNDKQAYWQQLVPRMSTIETNLRNMMMGCISLAIKSGIDTVIIPDCHPTLRSLTWTLEKLESMNIEPDEIELVTFLKNSEEEILHINSIREPDDRMDEKVVRDLYCLCRDSRKIIKRWAKDQGNVTVRTHASNPLGAKPTTVD